MSNNIYHLLSQKKMTQHTLAQMVGVRREYINRIINGRITPRLTLGIRIAKALETPMEDLFFLDK